MNFLDKAGLEHLVIRILEKLNIKANANEALFKTPQELTDEEKDQVRQNLRFIGRNVEGQTFTIDGESVTASPNAEIFGDYDNNIATGQWSIAEGSYTTAKGRVAHAEGAYTQALQDGCHTEGYQTIATGYWSHAEGEMTRVTSYASHAEGSYTKMPDGSIRYGTASGYASHIEGGGCYAQGSCSHAEGLATTAKGGYSHSEGRYTVAGSNNQHVEGVANIEDTTGEYIHIAGNGELNARSNAYHLDWNGNGWFAGDVYVGSTSGTNKDEGSKKLATEEYVNAKNEELNEQINTALADNANQVEDLYKRLNSNATLGFYCVEDVTIVFNGISTTYPANSNVEIKLLDTDVFEIIPTSDNSILALNAFPGALGTYYSWLEGVKQFSNILFDMNSEDMYSKWSQGNQGAYQVQYAQYINCIFWSDNPYISDVARRTNYTLYYTSQLPLCYSSIPDNTFKSFYLAFNVTSDPNWGNKAYRDSFAKATWATQVFSYYGARTIGIFGHDDPDFNIVLPKDCRGLMYQSTAIENAGTFDAINVTNFGAKSGSWRDAFGQCSSLRNLYIKNLKVNLNVSWSPLNYESIYFIISKATNTNKITISVSPYTYNLLGSSDFELAASKNITIELLTTNYVEDKRLSDIANKADKSYVDNQIANKVDVSNAVISGSLNMNAAVEPGFAAAALGFASQATGMYSLAEGMGTTSSGDCSHSEGTGTTASGYAAHAEGSGSEATDVGAHAEGFRTKALARGTHAEGNETIATAEGQHVEGKFNIEDTGKALAHIAGNGTSNTERSNAHTLDWQGNAWYAGDVYVGSTSGTNKDDGSKKLATEEFVVTEISNIIEIITNDAIDAICNVG